MKKLLSIFCVIVLLATVLAGCKESNAGESEPATTETPTIPEITADELEAQFLLIYDDCGASVSEESEQLTTELTLLDKKAEADKKQWPDNYQTQYKAWRASTIKERADTVKAECEQIIAERILYEQGMPGLWETTPGLVYANYIDIENDGKSELMLLTWSNTDDSGVTNLEIYGDVKGHAVKYFEQSLDTVLGMGGMYISLVENEDGIPFLQVTAEDGGSGQNTRMNVFYTLGSAGLSVADIVFDYWYRDYDTDNMDGIKMYVTLSSEDSVVSDKEPNLNLWASFGGVWSDRLGVEITEEQYNAVLAKYSGNHLLFTSYQYTEIYETGVLPTSEIVPVPKIAVNGEVLELDVAPYLSGDVFMAPLRDVLEGMGVAVYANSNASVILASTKKDSLVMANVDFSMNEKGIEGAWIKRNNWYYSFNDGEEKSITPQISGGKTFVPLQEIIQLFGANSQWNSETKTIEISSSISDNELMSQNELKEISTFSLENAIQNVERNGYSYYSISALDMDDYQDVHGGIKFKNGHAVWQVYVIESEEHYISGFYVSLFRVDAASNGEVIAYPDEKACFGAGQF